MGLKAMQQGIEDPPADGEAHEDPLPGESEHADGAEPPADQVRVLLARLDQQEILLRELVARNTPDGVAWTLQSMMRSLLEDRVLKNVPRAETERRRVAQQAELRRKKAATALPRPSAAATSCLRAGTW